MLLHAVHAKVRAVPRSADGIMCSTLSEPLSMFVMTNGLRQSGHSTTSVVPVRMLERSLAIFGNSSLANSLLFDMHTAHRPGTRVLPNAHDTPAATREILRQSQLLPLTLWRLDTVLFELLPRELLADVRGRVEVVKVLEPCGHTAGFAYAGLQAQQGKKHFAADP